MIVSGPWAASHGAGGEAAQRLGRAPATRGPRGDRPHPRRGRLAGCSRLHRAARNSWQAHGRLLAARGSWYARHALRRAAGCAGGSAARGVSYARHRKQRRSLARATGPAAGGASRGPGAGAVAWWSIAWPAAASWCGVTPRLPRLGRGLLRRHGQTHRASEGAHPHGSCPFDTFKRWASATCRHARDLADDAGSRRANS